MNKVLDFYEHKDVVGTISWPDSITANQLLVLQDTHIRELIDYITTNTSDEWKKNWLIKNLAPYVFGGDEQFRIRLQTILSKDEYSSFINDFHIILIAWIVTQRIPSDKKLPYLNELILGNTIKIQHGKLLGTLAKYFPNQYRDYLTSDSKILCESIATFCKEYSASKQTQPINWVLDKTHGTALSLVMNV